MEINLSPSTSINTEDAATNDNSHRGSVCSTRSLDLPITPTRTHKKVSFSDSLPIISAGAPSAGRRSPSPSPGAASTTRHTALTPPPPPLPLSAPPMTTAYAGPPKPITEQELSAVNHVLLKAANYLEQLHGGARHEENTTRSARAKRSSSASPTPMPRQAVNRGKAGLTDDEIDAAALAVLHLKMAVPERQPPKPSLSRSCDPSAAATTARETSAMETALASPGSTSTASLATTSAIGAPSPAPSAEELHEIALDDTQTPQEKDHYANRYNLNLHENCSSMEIEARREKIRWLLISECSALWDGGKHTLAGFKTQFLEQEFQRKLFHLFDLEGRGYLLQDRWIEHLKGRLNEDKQIDFAERIESVAYVICGENSKVTLKNFNEIWQTRGILEKLYRLIDVDGANLISTNQIMEFISHITNTRPRTGFDKSSLARLEQLFRQAVGNEQEICREEFKKIVTSKNPFFTERVFQIFDKDNSGSISLQEFIDAIHQFSGQSADDKIRFLFKVYDIDGDGLIQQKEFHDVIRACMEENGMEFSDEQIEELTTAMFEDADALNRGEITYEALKNQLHKHGGLLENLTISIDRWLVPMAQEKPVASNAMKKWTDYIPIPHQFTPQYMKNNPVYISYLIFYIGMNIGLFISRAIQYRASNGYVIVARACGQCLNFNCAWILVLMLRHSITFLRSRGLSSYLPLDNHIYLHKLTGIVVSVLSLLHTIMHIFNFSLIVINDPKINAGHYTIAEWLLTDRPGLFGLIPGCANPTGMALFIILLIMYICSQPFVRRKGSFEIFYWSHLLYVPFWVLLLFHGPNFWKWFLLPGIAYIIERCLRMYWMHGEHGKTYISSGILLPSKVIHLVIRRPYNFHFRPGDYVFVNIPTIANYEWHPFTISSAPEQEDYMWLHIRTVGQWTKKLYYYFEQEQEKLQQLDTMPASPPRDTIKNTQVTRVDEIRNGSGKSSATPQIDFLSRNLAQIQKTTSSDAPVRPPRHNQHIIGSEKPSSIESEDNGVSATSSNGVSTVESRKDRIRSIKRTLERTFSSKNNRKISATVDDTDSRLSRHVKPPLERSMTVPDMPPNMKRAQRLKKLHSMGRSESEWNFIEYPANPKNKSLEQSFRYMRNKPTIIAFKTPSMENCDPNNYLNKQTAETPKEAEEGTVQKAQSSAKSTLHERIESNITLVSGKPLEDASNTNQTRTKTNRFRRPTFLRSLSTSIKNHGSNGSLPLHGTAHSGGKVTLDAGVLEIYIDGPYGAPSSHIFSAQHAVLIGTGIGVTPFASILQSIMHRYWKARHTCPQCNYEWASDIPKSVMNLRKVDFFWINRDQRSFEWFVNLLSQLEIEQAELGGAMERFLDMHMYITSALQRTDMKAVGLQLALDLLHEKGKRDLITGLKTRTNAGRPNWDKVFQQLKAQKKGKVTVFYCGPPQLARTLRYKCDQYGFSFRKESF